VEPARPPIMPDPSARTGDHTTDVWPPKAQKSNEINHTLSSARHHDLTVHGQILAGDRLEFGRRVFVLQDELHAVAFGNRPKNVADAWMRGFHGGETVAGTVECPAYTS
jgi:hypothetical protein